MGLGNWSPDSPYFGSGMLTGGGYSDGCGVGESRVSYVTALHGRNSPMIGKGRSEGCGEANASGRGCGIPDLSIF